MPTRAASGDPPNSVEKWPSRPPVGATAGASSHAGILEGFEQQMLFEQSAHPGKDNETLKSPLIAACEQGDKGLVDILLSAGADVNAESAVHGTALQVA